VPGGVFENGPDGHTESRGLTPSPVGQQHRSGSCGGREQGGQPVHDASLLFGSLEGGLRGRQRIWGGDSLVAFETAFQPIPESRARVFCGVGKNGEQGTRGHDTGGGHAQDQGSPTSDEAVALAEHVGLEPVVQVETDGIEALSEQPADVGGGGFGGAHAQDASEVPCDFPRFGRGLVWRTAEDEASSMGGHEGIPAGSRADVKGGDGCRNRYRVMRTGDDHVDGASMPHLVSRGPGTGNSERTRQKGDGALPRTRGQSAVLGFAGLARNGRDVLRTRNTIAHEGRERPGLDASPCAARSAGRSGQGSGRRRA
jgi:hypothetical protein